MGMAFKPNTKQTCNRKHNSHIAAACQPAPTTNHRQVHLAIKQKQKKEEEKGVKMLGQFSNCFCRICFDFKPAFDVSQEGKCNHPFCTDCISEYVAAKIKKNIVKVSCPNPSCCVELKPEYLQPILPKDVFFQWEFATAKYKSSIALSQVIYCPIENCSVLMVKEGDRRHVNETCYECSSCHRLFCVKCKVPWHAGMNCEGFQEMKKEEDLDRKFMELAKREMWQRCPKCSMYVQRYGGCEHITCRCGCNFCYRCGENWSIVHVCKIRRT